VGGCKQAGRGFLSSAAAARPCERSGFGFNVVKQETGKVLCGEAEHLIARNFRIEKQETSLSSIPKLLRKYGDNKVDGTVVRSEGT